MTKEEQVAKVFAECSRLGWEIEIKGIKSPQGRYFNVAIQQTPDSLVEFYASRHRNRIKGELHFAGCAVSLVMNDQQDAIICAYRLMMASEDVRKRPIEEENVPDVLQKLAAEWEEREDR